MNELIRKLSSRKLWAAVAGVVAGLAMVFGLDENTVTSVAGAVVSLASIITYIVTEGKIDAESAKAATDVIFDLVEDMTEEAGQHD